LPGVSKDRRWKKGATRIPRYTLAVAKDFEKKGTVFFTREKAGGGKGEKSRLLQMKGRRTLSFEPGVVSNKKASELPAKRLGGGVNDKGGTGLVWGGVAEFEKKKNVGRCF